MIFKLGSAIYIGLCSSIKGGRKIKNGESREEERVKIRGEGKTAGRRNKNREKREKERGETTKRDTGKENRREIQGKKNRRERQRRR